MRNVEEQDVDSEDGMDPTSSVFSKTRMPTPSGSVLSPDEGSSFVPANVMGYIEIPHHGKLRLLRVVSHPAIFCLAASTTDDCSMETYVSFPMMLTVVVSGEKIRTTCRAARLMVVTTGGTHVHVVSF